MFTMFLKKREKKHRHYSLKKPNKQSKIEHKEVLIVKGGLHV